MSKIKLQYFLPLLSILILYGCALHVSISDIKNDPSKYQDKQVIVKGEVTEVIGLPFAYKGIYQVDDGTDTIWIFSQKVPSKGTKVTVKGVVKRVITINDSNYGTVIIEKEK
ncbi:MAG: hypothetical protein QG641_112 [Candidatus Poribacteria bacterium]|nr:hypothetical protein [Candidatus Poribacteria bacterium]